MLRRVHAIAEYHAGQLLPDRLLRHSHGQYVGHAERMLRVYQLGVGRTRKELHQAVGAVFAAEPECPARRIEAFRKLLDDASDYQRDRRGQAAKLRCEVFRMATDKHPLVRRADRLFDHEELAVKTEIARRLGKTWGEIDRDLFSDIIEFHRLKRFHGYPTPEALLARYNVAQVQVALFDAESMTVWASDDFKTILRHAKLAQLMHSITRRGENDYLIRFDGPASVLRATRRYGVAMAKFLPSMIACHGWRMHATIRTRRRGFVVALRLSEGDGLQSHLMSPEPFDSNIEAAFAEKWGAEPRDGWRLEREGEILHHHQKVFVPDFTFHHEDGRLVVMEIIGFWTPEYLEAKLATLALFAESNILLAVAHSLQPKLPEPPPETIIYKTALRVKDVLERLK